MLETFSKFKAPALACCVILGSFVLGYQGDNLNAWWEETQKTEDAPVEKTVVNVKKKQASDFQTPTLVPTKQAPIQRTRPNRKPPPAPAMARSPFPGASSFMYAPRNPHAPYQSSAFQNAAGPTPRSPYPKNLDNTMDSISAAGVEDRQIIKRNLYFEKLSQQLKELQGKNVQIKPPEPPPPPEAGQNENGAPEVPDDDEPPLNDPIDEPFDDFGEEVLEDEFGDDAGPFGEEDEFIDDF